MVEYKTRHVTPNGVVMDDYHFENGVTITLIPCKEINENMTRRRRINPRVLHVEEVDNIKYVCKGVPENGTFYLFGILK